MPTTAQWRFTALEFAVLWQQLGRDRLPYPLQFRGDAETEREFQIQRQDAAQLVLPRLDRGLHEALSSLAAPDIRIEVCGFHSAGLTTMTRAHAGVLGEWAAVAHQDSGVDLDTGADVLLTSVPVGEVSARIAEMLPPARRGTRRGVGTAGPTQTPRSAGSLMLPATRLGTEEERDEFFDRPRTGLGEIGVFAGPAVDWRPTTDGHIVHWMDFEDDGRYLVRGGAVVSVLPAQGADVASELRRLIGVVRGRG